MLLRSRGPLEEGDLVQSLVVKEIIEPVKFAVSVKLTEISGHELENFYIVQVKLLVQIAPELLLEPMFLE